MEINYRNYGAKQQGLSISCYGKAKFTVPFRNNLGHNTKTNNSFVIPVRAESIGLGFKGFSKPRFLRE